MPNMSCWLVTSCIEDLRRFSGISTNDLEAGDNQSLKFKWRDLDSNPGPLALQAKSLTTRPRLLPPNMRSQSLIPQSYRQD